MKILFTAFCCMLILCVHAQEPATLTAVYDSRKNTVKLKWMNSISSTTRFVLQRSADNLRWTDIYTVYTGQGNTNRLLSFEDKNVTEGIYYYRLKEYQGLHSDTRESIVVILGKTGKNWLMYPVPVKDVLNLQYNGSQVISGVITVTIQNVSSGYFFHKLRFASTNRLIQIPVSNLGRGIYDVGIYIGNQAVWNQRFVK